MAVDRMSQYEGAEVSGEDAAGETSGASEQAEIDREMLQTGEALRAAADREEQDREEHEEEKQEGRPRVEAPSPAQWVELRARRGDSLAAARAILKDAGSVTRWAQVLTAQARGLLRQGGERRGDQALVVRLEGDLDLAASPALLALLRGLAADEAAMRHSRTVVVDLEAVGLLDGSGCAALIEGRKALAGRGLELAVLLRPGSQPEGAFVRQSLGTILRRVGSLDAL